MDISPTRMRAWRAFLETYSLVIRRLERDLVDERELPLSWYDVLVQLNENGGRMRIGDLASHLLVSRSATTRFVDRLERDNLISRETVAEDRRGTWVVLTDQGRATLREAAPVHLRGIDDYFAAHLSDDESEELIKLLAKVNGAHS